MWWADLDENDHETGDYNADDNGDYKDTDIGYWKIEIRWTDFIDSLIFTENDTDTDN